MSDGVNLLRQERRNRALNRLVNSAIDLMSTGNFDDIPVTEVFRNAGCSVGTFCNRFEGKDALFHLIQERILDDAQEWVRRRFNEKEFSRTGSLNTEEAATAIVTALAGLYSRNGGAYRAVLIHARIKKDMLLTQRLNEFHAWCRDQVHALCERVECDGNRDAATRRWILGFELLTSYLREKILFDEITPVEKKEGGEVPLDELVEIYARYARSVYHAPRILKCIRK